MNQGELLYQAILADPDDDAPRLVYADWLEERGQPGDLERATFIRAQLDLEATPEDDPRHRAVKKRVEAIPLELRESWDPEIRELVKEVEYRRGFADGVTLDDGPAFVKVARRLFDLAPIRGVELTNVWSRFTTWAKCPYLERIRRLTLCGRAGDWTADSLHRVLSPRTLSTLTELDVNENFDLGMEWGETLAKLSHLQNLRSLKLRGNWLEDEGMSCLIEAAHLSNLTALDLGGNGLMADGVYHLANCPTFGNLTDLRFGRDCERDNRNYLADAGIEELVKSPCLTRLRTLILNEVDIGMDGTGMLATWPGLASVRRLHLTTNDLVDDEIKALADSPHVANLRILDISQNWFGDDGVEALLASPYLSNLFDLTVTADEDHLSPAIWQQLRERFGEGLNGQIEKYF